MIQQKDLLYLIVVKSVRLTKTLINIGFYNSLEYLIKYSSFKKIFKELSRDSPKHAYEFHVLLMSIFIRI
jgi:hypothetical protein